MFKLIVLTLTIGLFIEEYDACLWNYHEDKSDSDGEDNESGESGMSEEFGNDDDDLLPIVHINEKGGVHLKLGNKD